MYVLISETMVAASKLAQAADNKCALPKVRYQYPEDEIFQNIIGDYCSTHTRVN